jgi:GNAT superfamily N-acetyltransferase
MVLAFGTVAHAAETLSFAQEQSIPPAARNILEAEPMRSHYAPVATLNPFYVQGDFDGDRRLDTAILVKERKSGKVGIAVILAAAAKVHVIGANQPAGSGGDDFAWLDAWYAYPRDEVAPGAGDAKPPVLRVIHSGSRRPSRPVRSSSGTALHFAGFSRETRGDMERRAAVKVLVEDAPQAADLEAVNHGLIEHAAHSGIEPRGHRALTVFARDDRGRLVGGLVGDTVWGWLQVKEFWVAAAERGKGHGTRLLEAAEREAIRRGCHHAMLDTFDFQARDFYERLGYAVFGSLDDFPRAHVRLFMKKALSV